MDTKGNQTERFDFILETEGQPVAAAEFIAILQNFQLLLENLNRILNIKYNAGFDNIAFELKGLESNSNNGFNISMNLCVSTSQPSVASIGDIITQLFEADKTSIKTKVGKDVLVIDRSKLLESVAIRSALATIAKLVVQLKKNSGLSIKSEKDTLKIEKWGLMPLATMRLDDQSEAEINVCKTRLKIVSPVLDNYTIAWKFRTMEGFSLSAKINDIDFLQKLDDEHIAFGKYDVLEVQLMTVIHKSSDGHEKITYSVEHVFNYPKYKRKDAPLQLELDF